MGTLICYIEVSCQTVFQSPQYHNRDMICQRPVANTLGSRVKLVTSSLLPNEENNTLSALLAHYCISTFPYIIAMRQWYSLYWKERFHDLIDVHPGSPAIINLGFFGISATADHNDVREEIKFEN
jgi:hypothetical protein